MAMTTSPDTLLRRVKRLKNEPAGPPRVVGIDDWAWRKGQRYGTIVVDLERSDVIDLLPDRDADTVAAWLKAHPGVEVVSRDRSATYAQAATEGASAGRAGRRPLAPAEEPARGRRARARAALRGHQRGPQGPGSPSGAGPRCRQPLRPTRRYRLPNRPRLGPPVEPVPESPRLQAKRAKRRELVERFERVHELHKRGYPAARIARELGLSRRSVFRYLRRETCPAWHLRGSRRSRLDGYREWIDARIAEGFMNVADLHRQLTERGFQGSYGSVYAFVTKRLGAAGKKRERLNAADSAGPEAAVGKAALLRVGPTTGETQASRTGAARRHPRLQRRAGRGAGPGGRVRRPDP